MLDGLPGTGTLPVNYDGADFDQWGGIVNLEYMIKRETPNAMK